MLLDEHEMAAESHIRQLPDRVIVGRVRRPHGVRGEVVVTELTDIAGRFDEGSQLVARMSSGESLSVVVASARPHGDVSLVRFEGCEDRDAAERFRAAMLEVERSAVPPSPEGAFYYYELVGCRCFDRRSGELGEVVGLIEDGGGLLLELQSSRGRVLIPFVKAYVASIDIERGLIELDLPSDLVETCTSTS